MLRYFLSGSTGALLDLLPRIAECIDFRLLSMHKSFKSNTKEWTAITHHPKCGIKEVMLDSGAFTAFVQGKQLAVSDLIAVYEDTIPKISKKVKHIWLINLDVIAGAYGRQSTQQEMDDALTRSDVNFRILKKRFGDRVLPVYHQTEPFSRLQEVVKQAPFIGMGFRQDFSEEFRIRVAEQALQYAHSKGVAVHGLATTGYRMLSRAPFDSVDSATWLYTATMGSVFFVDESGTKLITLGASKENPGQKDHRGHYLSVTKEERTLIDRRAKEAGLTMDQVSSHRAYRILFNAHQLREWLRIYQRPAITAEKGLFSL